MTPAATPTPGLDQGVLQRAALLGGFDPRDLLPAMADAAKDPALADLAALCDEREVDGAWLWALLPDARRAALARLPPPGAGRARLLADLPLRPGDGFGAAAVDLLAPHPRPELKRFLDHPDAPLPDKLGTDRLLALFQVYQLFLEAGVVLSDWAADIGLGRRLERAVVRRGEDATAEALLGTGFRGRTRELALLLDFAGTGEATGPGADLLKPLPGRSEEPIRQDLVPALVVTGIGGVGKSALMEVLRRRLRARADLATVVLDLDQVALRGGDRVAMTLELLWQIGRATPGLETPISGLRSGLRDTLTSAATDGRTIEAGSRAVLGALSDLGALLDLEGLRERPLVLVLDTFEEALVTGEERVRLIADWVVTVARQFPPGAVRTIISGRAAEDVGRMPAANIHFPGYLELGDLGTRAGRSVLTDIFVRDGVRHRDLVPGLVATFGSNPLVLTILGRFCKTLPRKRIERLIGDSDPSLRKTFDAEVRQRFLYTRILERLRDKELRRLASPGLVLRRITPQLIEEVLAPALGLALPFAPGHARDLFGRLAREVWLVRNTPGRDELNHLPDLRRVMLPHVLAEKDARRVAETAADWYDRRDREGDPFAAWEKLYYRALIDPATLPDDDEALRQFADVMAGAVADLHLDAQARINAARGRVLRRDEIARLSGDVRRRAATKRMAQQVSEGLESTVVEEFYAAPEHEPNPFEDLLIREFRPAPSRASRAAGEMPADDPFGEAAKSLPDRIDELRARARDLLTRLADRKSDDTFGSAGLDGLLDTLGDLTATLGQQKSVPDTPPVLRPRPPPPASREPLPEPELATAWFAEGAFDRLAARADDLIVDSLLHSTFGTGSDRRGPALDHPAHLAALSALDQPPSTRPRPRALGLLLDMWEERETFQQALVRRAQAEAEVLTETPLAAAVLAVHLSGHDPRALFGPGLDALRRLPAFVTGADALPGVAAWRLASILSAAPDLRQAPTGAALPMFAPELRGFLDGRSTSAHEAMRALEALNALGSRGRDVRLTDLARAEQDLSGLPLRIAPAELAPDTARLFLPGRLPDFHAPLRSFLNSLADPGHAARPVLPEAVASIAAEVPWWPVELRPDVFQGTPNSTIIAALIDTADRCGRLPVLIRDMAGAPQAGPMPALARILEAFLARFAALTDRPDKG